MPSPEAWPSSLFRVAVGEPHVALVPSASADSHGARAEGVLTKTVPVEGSCPGPRSGRLKSRILRGERPRQELNLRPLPTKAGPGFRRRGHKAESARLRLFRPALRARRLLCSGLPSEQWPGAVARPSLFPLAGDAKSGDLRPI